MSRRGRATLDASDIVDDATIGALPADVSQAGTTLTWAVPATALAATSSVAIPFTVNAGTTGNTLKGVTRPPPSAAPASTARPRRT